MKDRLFLGRMNRIFRMDRISFLPSAFCLLPSVFCLLSSVFCLAQVAPVQRVVLPNGVRLLLKPEPSTEIVAITVFVRMSPEANPKEAAVGEMVAQSVFFSSLNRSLESIADSVAQVGGSLETFRVRDYVVFTCLTVNVQAREAIYLLSESLKNADFAPDALKRAYENILKERERQEQNGFRLAQETLRHRIQQTEEPSAFALQHVTQEQAQVYFRSHYVPSQTVITVVGRFSVKGVKESFENNLVDYDRPAPKRSEEGVMSGKEVVSSLKLTTGGSAAYALVATAAPDVTSPDYPAFTVLQTLLGGGHASRLFRRVRDSLGIGYTVGAVYPSDLAGPLYTYLQWDANRLKVGDAALSPALKLLEGQLDAILSDPPVEAEIARARKVAIGRDALRHERARERAFLLGQYEVMGLGYTFDMLFPTQLAAVTRADILRVAKTYLSTRASALVTPKTK